MANSATAQSPLPLAPERQTFLAQALSGLDAPTMAWVSGYVAALAGVPLLRSIGAPQAAPQTAVAADFTIAYGSQTGNSRRVAEALHTQVLATGVNADLLDIRKLKPAQLTDMGRVAFVISTQGEGEPPEDALAFFEQLNGRRAPKLDGLNYAVFALGDSSYPKYCETGRVLDARLAELGGSRFLDTVEVDVDFDAPAKSWRDLVVARVQKDTPAVAQSASVVILRPASAKSQFSREQPFAAEVLANQRISARDSNKDVRHVELLLEGANFQYEPGDSIGVWPRNPQPAVRQVIASLGANAEQVIERDGVSLPLQTWLSEKLEITRLSRPILAAHAALSRDSDLNRLLAPEQNQALANFLTQHQLLDLLEQYPAEWDSAALLAALRPITPRLYSIASSRKAVGDEAHLTVSRVLENRHGKTRFGAATDFLAQAASDGSAHIPVYLERNERFRLPSDGSKDILMIGPGTGVAPFRGFVQERAAEGARGRNWLLFGEQTFRNDFLYQTEWQEALRNGELHRLDLAFSRDQADKIYVQHRLLQAGEDVYDWLQSGAYVYVCGDASRMAADVHAALKQIVITHGAVDTETAEAYLSNLRDSDRYARDVY